MSGIPETVRLVYNSFRQCANCGALWASIDHGLCAECWQHIQKYRSRRPGLRPSERGELVSYALFVWPPWASDALSSFILANKGWTLPEQQKFLARELIKQMLALGFAPRARDIVVVPAPSRRPPWRDQGYLLAREVAHQLQYPFCPVLRTCSFRTQRRLGRVARQHLRIEKNSGLSLRGKRVLFVDDVVTTGATATRSRKALSEAVDFTLCCLADRNLSCEDDTGLL